MNVPITPESIAPVTATARQEPRPPESGAPAQAAPKADKRRGVVLIAVLVVVASLSLAGYHYSDSMVSEYKASENAHRNVQARTFAASGVHYTAALLSNPENFAAVLNGNPWNNPNMFQNIEIDPGSNLKGRFSIIAPPAPDDNSDLTVPYYGVGDEGGKINPNMLMKIDPTGQRLHDVLVLLPNMTEDIANCIVAWMGGSVGVTNGGAGNDVYSAMSPPYRAKGGPIDSIDELLLVRGVTRDLLYGTDFNRNGSQEGNESGSNGFDRGWSGYLTVHSREPNSDVLGVPYIFLNTVFSALDDTAMKQVYDGLTAGQVSDDMAKFIILYRQYKTTARKAGSTPAKGETHGTLGEITLAVRSGQTITSVYDLIDIEIVVNKKILASPLTSKDGSQFAAVFAAATMIDPTDATNPQYKELGRLNVMTAPRAVLAAFPELTPADVDNIITARPKLSTTDAPDPAFASPIWLNTKASVKVSTLKKLEKYVTTRTQVYRFQAVGYFEGKGPAIRIEAVIDTNAGRPRILMWRDLTELGKGWNDMPAATP